jgi:hypothetical protein
MTSTLTDQETVNHPDYARWEAEHGPIYAQAMVARELRQAADRAALAQKNQDLAALWATVHLPPIPFLESLYDAVLERSEKRMPKWEFRLAADVMLEIQPKLTRTGRLFHWQALKCEGANKEMFASPRTRVHPHTMLGGKLCDVDGGAGYTLKVTSVGWSTSLDRVAGLALCEQIIAAFREGRFDRFTPGMLGNHCLLCGKGLTDPVSMARFLGPECAGTSSSSIPWLRNVTSCDGPEDLSGEELLRRMGL